jgi:hypothetical protein
MPELTPEYTNGLAPLIGPFEGHPQKNQATHLMVGEDHNDEFLPFIHNGNNNHKPDSFKEELYVTLEEVEIHKIDKGNSYREKCFLWVIDATRLLIIREMTPNIKRTQSVPGKPYVCHTNITGGGRAYIGGEMYFCIDGKILVNFSSDRYGFVATEEKKITAIRFMEDCRYKELVRVDQFI